MDLTQPSADVHQTVGIIALFTVQISGEMDPAGMYGYLLKVLSLSRCELSVFIYSTCLCYKFFSLWDGKADALCVRKIFVVVLSLAYNLLSDAGAEMTAWLEIIDGILVGSELMQLQWWVLTTMDWSIHLPCAEVRDTWRRIQQGDVWSEYSKRHEKTTPLLNPPVCGGATSPEEHPCR